MAGHKKWSSLRFKGTPAEQAAGAEKARAAADRAEEAYRASMAEIRKARAYSQREVAAALGVSQAQVCRLENQPDLYLSSLERYLRAIGARLELWVALRTGLEWSWSWPKWPGGRRPSRRLPEERLAVVA